MKKNIFWKIAVLLSVLILSGCAVRTYTVVKDRVDQDLTAGNKGYIMGQAPQALETPERKATRTTYVTEVELPSLSKLGRKSQAVTTEESSESPAAESQEKPAGRIQAVGENIAKYKVVNGDTLEKISKKFYGTTKKWVKIYEVNKDRLKAPDKIYPGQILDIPVENLKQ